MTTPIQLKVDQAHLVQGLRFAFQDGSLYSEMAQNARRAGASKFEIEEHTDRVVFRDDGCGIDSMQSLLTIASSSWDALTQATEQPYGLGFCVALYKSKCVRVRSKGLRFDAFTEDILNFSAAQVFTDNDPLYSGTEITLWGVEERDRRGPELFAGFPIPVSINGNFAARPHADGCDFTDTAIGRVRNCRWDLRQPLQLYLQGLPIDGQHYRSFGNCVVVHLSPLQFIGTAPDRSGLVNSAEAYARIHETLDDVRRTQVLYLYKSRNYEPLLKHPHEVCLLGLAKLYNDIDVLPAEVLAYPDWDALADDPDQRGFSFGAAAVSRAEVNALAFIAPAREVDKFEADYGSWFNTVQYVMALDKRGALLDTSDLDPQHWIFTLPNYVKTPEFVLQYQPLGAPTIFHLDGPNTIEHTKQLTLAHKNIAEPMQVEAAMRGDSVIVTENVAVSSLCQAFSSFRDEHENYREDWCDAACDALRSNMTAVFGGSIGKMIASLIACSPLNLTPYVGWTFTLRIDAGRKITVCKETKPKPKPKSKKDKKLRRR